MQPYKDQCGVSSKSRNWSTIWPSCIMPGHIPKGLYSLLQRFPPINVHCCSNITARKWEIQSSGTRVSTVWQSKGRRGSQRKDMGVYLECLRSWQGHYIAVCSVPWRALVVGVSVLTLGRIPYYIHFCGVWEKPDITQGGTWIPISQQWFSHSAADAL